jgi:rRNA biogenesis protein RRP5
MPKPQQKHKRPKAAPAAAPDSFAHAAEALKKELRASKRPRGPPEPSQVVQAWDDDETTPFPRGGASALAPLEHKAVTEQARTDAQAGLFDEAAEDAAPAEHLGLTADTEGSHSKEAHCLRRKELAAGVRLLGAVSDVSSDRLVLQLPNRLVGRVPREEISDELHAALSAGTASELPDLRKLFRRGEVPRRAPAP